MTAFRLLVVAGPSGVGKGTILKLIREKYAERLCYSISHTTRKPREGEVDGEDYHFTSMDEFKKMVDDDQFVEHAQFSGNHYGTSRKALEVAANQRPNGICLLEIELHGVEQLQKKMKDQTGEQTIRYVFILPPNLKELENRLRLRKTESEEVISTRLKTAIAEIQRMETLHKDHTLVNNDLQEAFSELCQFIDNHF